MTSFFNNLLRGTEVPSQPAASIFDTPHARKRSGDLEGGHTPTSYEKPDKYRAVAGPRQEQFDKVHVYVALCKKLLLTDNEPCCSKGRATRMLWRQINS